MTVSEVKTLIVMLLSFFGGLMVSGGIFAFITIIGVVPSIAKKTKTESYIKFFEECIIFGGIFGCCSSFIDYNFNLEKNFISYLIVTIIFITIGAFYGVLASSLAETLDVIPILAKRTKIKKNIFLFMFFIAIGKLLGSILYFTIPGFQT